MTGANDPAPAWLDAVERDAALREPGALAERSRVLDRLDRALVLGDASWHARIAALTGALQAADERLFAAIRQAIRCGEGAAAIRAVRGDASASPPGAASSDSYDHLDTLLGGILPLAPAVEPGPLREDMVFYQPTPARHLFDALDRLALGARDVLVDLGAGLGHVPLLAAICSPARCVGIEWEGAYVAAARACAGELGLERVVFAQGDVCAAPLYDGTVFYLYTPVRGAMLRILLDRLHAESRRRPVRLCTLGPCTPEVAAEPWLRADGPCGPARPAIFRSLAP